MRSVGRWTRIGVAAQVLLALALAVGGAVLAVAVADWRYFRLDLSASGRNSLDEAVLDLIDQLPEPVTADVFFRPLKYPYDGVTSVAQSRMLSLLFVAAQARRNDFEVRVHDASDFESMQLRQRELGIEGVNLVVYSNASGTRQAVQTLFSDIAVVDWGNPTRGGLEYLEQHGVRGIVDFRTWNPDPRAFRPPRLSAFRGEEALAQGLLKVSATRRPRVYFSRGQGEPDPHGTLAGDLGGFRRALDGDAFEVLEWNPAEGTAVPADCEVLVLVGPSQPFPPGTQEEVRAYVARGGQVIAAPRPDAVERGASGGVVELLRGFGMIAEPGIVCEEVVAPSGQRVQGIPECGVLLIGEGGLSASHRFTEPLLRRGRRVQFSLTPSFRRGGLEAGGVLLDLASSSAESWRDLPAVAGRPDFRFDPKRERRDRYSLVMIAELPAGVDDAGEVLRGRMLGIASADFVTDGLFEVNRDFLLNASNWMVEREHRVRVSPIPEGTSYLDLARGRSLPVLSYVLHLGLPGLCVGVGLVLAWRRRR